MLGAGKAERERSVVDRWRKQTEESAMVRHLTDQLHDTQIRLKKVEEHASALMQKLETVTVERDAATALKEDYSTQLRMMKKRLQAAEEEQVKSEEDAAALRAELETVQRAAHGASAQSRLGSSPEQFRIEEQERKAARAELESTLMILQGEQKKLAMERQRAAELFQQKQEFEQALKTCQAKLREAQQIHAHQEKELAKLREGGHGRQAESSAAIPDSFSSSFKEIAVDEAEISSEEKKGLEEQEVQALRAALEKAQADKQQSDRKMRELAMMVERLEKGRQRLLSEVDSQSLEIERLFMENSGLAAGLRETHEIAGRWERQLKECLSQNEELRKTLIALRSEQGRATMESSASGNEKGPSAGADAHTDTHIPPTDDSAIASGSLHGRSSSSEGRYITEEDWRQLKGERAKLQVELAKSMSRIEELTAQCTQMSADYTRVIQTLNGLGRMYKPVLANFESRLKQMIQEGTTVAG
ncbi:hypothetical protein CBR_g23966 [Chara braunii]|uniref:Uncharacterized protein n=1 Tax=Chara braunii TaxID=69332 RepID=A0A388L5K4_CHABU|nr:hypothetical protein CBR_g23966 [Chara braunii]|eukprot:GBG77522.1 hypothetical protein CBR_g23966 [Chara braunii]